MSTPVSIVIPSLDRYDLLAANLPPLLGELERRSAGDEVIVVDDSGKDALAVRLAAAFPSVVAVTREENGGFARALLTGVERARHAFVFSMNSDVRPREGFLEPLAECLAEDDVAAAVPRVLLDGDEGRIESVTELRLQEGLLLVHQEGLTEDAPLRHRTQPFPVAFPVGGTFLFRREEFLARDGFDSLYEPFYWEDVDLGFSWWREGRRVLLHPAAVVEHHHRGTIGELVSEDVFRAAIEKNRLLFAWKHLDDPELLRDHLAALHRLALDAWMGDEPRELVWLCLALEQLEEALAARSSAGCARGLREVLEASRPDA